MSDDAKTIFVSNLNRLLELRGKQQIDIVHELDVSSATVSDWCNGKKYPRIDKMELLADFLGVGLSALISPGGADEAVSMWKLTIQEQRLISAYRAADPRYRDLAMELLEEHPEKSMRSGQMA